MEMQTTAAVFPSRPLGVFSLLLVPLVHRETVINRETGLVYVSAVTHLRKSGDWGGRELAGC